MSDLDCGADSPRRHPCCFVYAGGQSCERLADWGIYPTDDPYADTYSCAPHIHAMLDPYGCFVYWTGDPAHV